jgi:hypothetical protein
MLSGPTWSAAEMAGTAVLRMVVSSDSMKKATATSQGRRRLLATERPGGGAMAGVVAAWEAEGGIGPKSIMRVMGLWAGGAINLWRVSFGG